MTTTINPPATAPAPVGQPGHWRRLGRVLDPRDHRAVLIPFDHGLSKGPIAGIEDPRAPVRAAVAGGADAIMCHAGVARYVYPELSNTCGIVIKLTDGASDGTQQVLLGSVEQAARYAADMVCVEFFLGAPAELDAVQTVGEVKREAELLGLPVLVAAYVHPTKRDELGSEGLLRACRLAVEMGADLVKTNDPGSAELFERLVQGTHAPVVVAGGQLGEHQALLDTVERAMAAGGAGVAVGRNVWASADPVGAVAELVGLVHDHR